MDYCDMSDTPKGSGDVPADIPPPTSGPSQTTPEKSVESASKPFRARAIILPPPQWRLDKESPSERDEQPGEGDEVPTEDGEAGGKSYDPAAAARADSDTVIPELRGIIADLQEEVAALRKEAAQTSETVTQALKLAERHQTDYQQLIALLEEMLRRGPDQGPDLGSQAASRANALREETRRARKRWPGRVWDTIWEKLKTVLPRIWSMITDLLTVKEWTVSGKVGSDLFGLAQLGISITFGATS
jgi:hypothetical protein